MFKNYLLASMMLLGSMPAARANILTNGSFETTLEAGIGRRLSVSATPGQPFFTFF